MKIQFDELTRSLVPTLLLFACAAAHCAPSVQAVAFEQDFEKPGAGSSYSTVYWNCCVANPPPPAVLSDPSGNHFMRLAYNQVTDQVNGIAFDTFTAEVGQIELSFDFRMGGGNPSGDPFDGADGMGLVLLNTTEQPYFGTPGVPWPWSNTPDSGLPEEPNVEGSIGVGLDTWQNTDIGDPGNNHVSLHFNGTRLKAVEIDPAELNLEDNAWHSAVLKVNLVTGSVQFSIDGTTYIDAVLFGVSPCVRLRPAFYARTGGAYNDHDLDNIRVYTIPNIPELQHLEASPAVLWPPNHNMAEVTLDYDLDIGCLLESDFNTTITVASNEPAYGLGDGDASPDWEVVDAHHVRLRAERSGKGTGRIYTITLTCADKEGHVVSGDVSVSVPKNK